MIRAHGGSISGWRLGAGLVIMVLSALVRAQDRAVLTAERLDDLPDALGLAAAFAGTSGQALIVAGGTNFPDKKPWEGGTKRWRDAVYVLEPGQGKWVPAGQLPRPLASGVSISVPEGLLCIGGSDADKVYDDVFLLSWRERRLHRRDLPPLPSPLSSAAGALVGHTVYVAGGSATSNPGASESLRHFWALDLSAAAPAWRTLPTWPGPERYLPVTAGHEGEFYLFTGMRRALDETGKPRIEFLQDAYAYKPSADGSDGTWRRLADLPVAKAAAPSPALPIDTNRLAIYGGGVGPQDIGAAMNERKELSRTVLVYDIKSNQWMQAGEVPAPRCVATAITWRDGVVVPSGEVQAGVRSPQVWYYRWSSVR